MNLIQIPAQVVDFRPKADHSYKLSFNTRELSGAEVALLADSYMGEGWLVFKPNGELLTKDIPEGEADTGLNGKSPSQRLRNVLYVLWEQRGKPNKTFEVYYASKMSQLIDVIKGELEGGT